jgi:hypothetical protein
MSLRPFYGVQTVSGSAQPVFGTAVTAAVTPPPDQFSGNLTPGSNETQCTLTVTSTNGFLPGDRVAVGLTAAFKPGIVAAGSIPDQGMVKSITSGTAMVVQGLKKSHAASGEWCVLAETAGRIRIRFLGSNVLYIANASTVNSTDLSVIDVLAPSTLFDSGAIGTSQSWNTSTFWAYGTSSDTFVAALGQI